MPSKTLKQVSMAGTSNMGVLTSPKMKADIMITRLHSSLVGRLSTVCRSHPPISIPGKIRAGKIKTRVIGIRLRNWTRTRHQKPKCRLPLPVPLRKRLRRKRSPRISQPKRRRNRTALLKNNSASSRRQSVGHRKTVTRKSWSKPKQSKRLAKTRQRE